MYGEMTLLSVTVIFFKLEYKVPFELKNKYSEMNDEFSFVLIELTDEMLQKKLLSKLKSYLIGAGIHSEERIKQVCHKVDVIRLLRKYFFVSNFGTLLTFAQRYEMKSRKRLEAFAKKRDKLYKKILAKDFARKAIEDHEKMECHGEVSCVYFAYCHIVL